MAKHNGWLIPTWRGLVTMNATVAAIVMPLQLVFSDGFAGDVELLDWLLTLVLSVDVVVNFRTSVWRKASAQSEVASFRAKALLVIDVLAAIPFHAVVGLPVFHLFRLLKLFRVAAYMADWHRQHSASWSIMRLGFFTYWMVVSVNWLACGWLSLRGVNLHVSMSSSYVHALYWCIQTLTTVGYGDELPATDVERIYAMGLMIVGVGVYGYIIGNVASILANIDPVKAEYRTMMERLTTFMKYRRIPSNLQGRIREYYSYLWEKRLGYDESTILSALPSGLQTDVSLFLKKDIIEKVPIFKGASDEFIREIALQMRPVVYTPGDYVVRAGDAGRDMYFISRGTLEVVAKDGTTVYTTLEDGDFFGEIALLLNQPRSASVRAVEYCDLYRLEKDHFDRVLARYPDFAAHIQTMTKERQERGM